MIHGVEMFPLRRIQDERGMVMHMLKATDPHFQKFGEIYFSVIYPGVIKDRKSTRLNSSHIPLSRMPSSA